MNYLEKFTGGNTNINMDDLLRVQESNQSVINGMFKGYEGLSTVSATNKSFIISGGVVTVVDGVTIAITEGYYYTGVEEQVIKIDAQSITHVVGKFYHLLPTDTYEIEGNKTYADGQSRQTWKKTRGVLKQYDAEQTALYNTEQYLYISKLIGKYESRGAATGYDFEIGDFIFDFTERTLDLSTIVPTWATSVTIFINLVSTFAVVGDGGLIAFNQSDVTDTNSINLSCYTENTTKPTTSSLQFTIPIGADRTIVYVASETGAGLTVLDFIVSGYQ